MIPQLMDRPDTFETVRDRVAEILAAESASQQALAIAAGKDPQGWNLRVFTERSNPWEQYENDPSNTVPIVNVWYDSSTFDPRSSNIVERQGTTANINVDLYAVGYSEETEGGHLSGDEQAARSVQRALRLARNIIMAAPYTYLKMRGTVGQRWISSANVFQPAKDGTTAQSVIGARLTLVVQFNEFSPQYEPVTLETLGITISRAENGEILAQSDFNYGE